MIEAKATLANNPVSRREFLYYLWGASAAVLTAGTCGATAVWLEPAKVKPRSGEEDGLFTFLPAQFAAQSPSDPPVYEGNGNFWLSNTAQGLLALIPLCTACGCRYKWQPNGMLVYEYPHFVCPCCTSQFTKGGVWVAGVARRNLDQFTITVTTPNGTHTTPDSGGPVDISGAMQIVVDVEQKIMGKPNGLIMPTHSRPVLLNP